MLSNNYLAMTLTFIIALAWLRLCDFLAHRGWISSRLSRKIIHIGTGPIFVSCWLLFNDATNARWLAALVPFGITIQFILVGLGILKDEAAVQAMSRSGDRREILRGPLFYGIVFVMLTLLFWKNSPVGMVALMLMCGGDGVADIVGRRYGKTKLPWNRDKSLQGSLAVFLGGLFLAALILLIFTSANIFSEPFVSFIPGLLLIALVGVAVESLPIKDIDNLTVTLAAVLVGLMVFNMKGETMSTIDISYIHWLGHDSFRIEGEGIIIYIDPYQLKGTPPAADLILVTHDHFDHMSLDDIAKIANSQTSIVAPVVAAEKISGDVHSIKPGDSLNVKGIKIEAVPAYNINKFRSPGQPFHPKEMGYVGYIITVNGTRIYHAGDTDFIPEMKEIKTDVALLPVSGTYVMTAQEAAEAANALQPKVVVPMHVGAGIGTMEMATELKNLTDIPVIVLSIEK
jgi:L-ascorbate metabolism protein UlaG (beta-lactamase superfamily)/dolichol kinase